MNVTKSRRICVSFFPFISSRETSKARKVSREIRAPTNIGISCKAALVQSASLVLLLLSSSLPGGVSFCISAGGTGKRQRVHTAHDGLGCKQKSGLIVHLLCVRPLTEGKKRKTARKKTNRIEVGAEKGKKAGKVLFSPPERRMQTRSLKDNTKRVEAVSLVIQKDHY